MALADSLGLLRNLYVVAGVWVALVVVRPAFELGDAALLQFGSAVTLAPFFIAGLANQPLRLVASADDGRRSPWGSLRSRYSPIRKWGSPGLRRRWTLEATSQDHPRDGVPDGVLATGLQSKAIDMDRRIFLRYLPSSPLRSLRHPGRPRTAWCRESTGRVHDRDGCSPIRLDRGSDAAPEVCSRTPRSRGEGWTNAARADGGPLTGRGDCTDDRV